MNYFKETDKKILEGFIDEIARNYDAKGIGVLVTDSKGNTQYEYMYGSRDDEKKLPVDEDTVFGIASCTKSFTCMAIMQLQEQGLLDVNDPVSRYVPEFTGKYQKDLRIWHLCCHSGGFFPLERIVVDEVAGQLGISDESEQDLAYSDALAKEGIKQVAERLDNQTMDKGLIGRPGEYFSYCNDGFGVLSDIIRRVSGVSYADYIKEHILKPLGMDRSGCDFVKFAQDDNAAILYEKRTGVMHGDRDYHNNAFVLNGGGAMKSTLSDLKKYLCAYLGGGIGYNGARILSEYSVHEMCRPKQFYRPGQSYGYGLCIKNIGNMTVFEHGGSLPGVSSNISWSYEADAAVVVLCNTSDVPVSLIADAVLRAYNGQKVLIERPFYRAEPWSRSTLEDAQGEYSSGEGTDVKLYIKADGSLGLKVEDKEKIIIPTAPNMAVVYGKYSDGFIKLFRRDGKIFAIQYGSRMIPKSGRRV